MLPTFAHAVPFQNQRVFEHVEIADGFDLGVVPLRSVRAPPAEAAEVSASVRARVMAVCAVMVHSVMLLGARGCRTRRQGRVARSDAPAALDRLAPTRSVIGPAARQRPQPDARIFGREVSFLNLPL